MKIIKIKEAERFVKGKKEKEHYGYWVTIKPYTTSPFKFVVSEQVYPLLYQEIHTEKIKEGTNFISLIETKLA